MSEETTVESPQRLGPLLRAHRRRALLTQEELAELTRLSPRTIRRLESDRTRPPLGATLRVLAARLRLTPAEQDELMHAAYGYLRAAVPGGGDDGVCGSDF